MDKIVLTPSSAGMLQDCPRMYYYSYVEGLEYIYETTEPLAIGRAFHKGIELADPQAAVDLLEREVMDQFEADKLRIMQVTVKAMVKGAIKEWVIGEVPTSQKEVEFLAPIRSPHTGRASTVYQAAGRVDELVWTPQGYKLREYKTASQFPNYSLTDKVALDTQTAWYCWGLGQEAGYPPISIEYFMVRKPSIRQKQTESIEEYTQRLEQDYLNRPEFYFRAEEIPIEHSISQFEKHIWELTRLLSHYRSRGYWPMNTRRCSDWRDCKYRLLCTSAEDAHLFYVQKDKTHTELEV